MKKSKIVRSKSSAPVKRFKKYEDGGKKTSFAGLNTSKDVVYAPTAEGEKARKLKEEQDAMNLRFAMPSQGSTYDGSKSPSFIKSGTPKVSTKKIAGGFTSEAQKSAYTKNVKARMAKGATIDQLVKEKVGTRAGLENLGFKDAVKEQPKKDNKKSTVLPKNKASQATKTKPAAKVGETPSAKSGFNQSYDVAKDTVKTSKNSTKKKPDYSGKTTKYTNKKGVTTAEKLTISNGKPALTRTVTDKAGKKSIYVKSGDKIYLKSSDGKVKNLDKQKKSNYDKAIEARDIARGKQKKELATGAASSVDDFWTSGIGGAAKLGVSALAAGAAGLVGRYAGKQLAKKAVQKTGETFAKRTAANLALQNAAKATMKNKAGKQSFQDMLKGMAKVVEANTAKSSAKKAASSTAKLTKEKLAQQFAEKLSKKGSQKLLNKGAYSLAKTKSGEVAKKATKASQKAISNSSNIERSFGNGVNLLKERVSPSAIKDGAQKMLSNSKKMLKAPSKGLPVPKGSASAAASKGAKAAAAARSRSAARNKLNERISSSIKTNNPVSAKMVKTRKINEVVKKGTQKINKGYKSMKANKPSPGDQLKLNLRKGGKISYGRGSKKK